ncbi:MAG: hypothetical protein KatS3mg006_0583 [Pyrinomonadaceae bacterium]|nr:MAG: hypothetical protein KatS3mg006_0583 [Pyrinomonadaceae bacterium]
MRLLRWLRANNFPYEIDLLLLRGGELESEYRKLVDKLFLLPQPQQRTLVERFINRLKRELNIQREFPKIQPFSQRYDKIFANTALSLKYLKPFKERGSKTVCWIHELEFSIDLLCGRSEFIKAAEFADFFIACSKIVQDTLLQLGIKKEIHLVYEFVENSWKVPEEEIRRTKEELGIPSDAFVIGGCGTIDWRKGADLFLQIARKLAKDQSRNFYFVWLGSRLPSFESEKIFYDFKRIEANGKVIFAGPQPNPERFFACFDVFALTSREDPFPLVCLEAASLGKPTICFEKAGGMPEFIGNDAGKVVPYGDIDAFCKEIINFYDNREKLKTCGKNAQTKLLTEFNSEISCRKIYELLLE